MAKNKNRQRKTTQPVTPATEKIPLVSVIIPVFNAEKFLPQTLESLLYQTMTDFEVIAVDDCSTDNSIAVLESFVPKFASGGGMLHVIKLPTNSGSPEVPRNLAVNFSRGKYLAFLDNDDLYTPTALEELTTLAEKFQADVINTTAFFCFDGAQMSKATTEEILKTNHVVISCRNVGAVKLQSPTEVPDDIAERVKLWLNNDIHWTTWASFCKRDFWNINQIRFPIMPVSGDLLANFYSVCLAKKFLRVPNVTYIYRRHLDSASHNENDADKHFRKWLRNLTIGFKEFDKFMKRIPFFDERQDYRFAVFNWFFFKCIDQARHFAKDYEQIHSFMLNRIAEQEFSGDDAVFAAFLFNTTNLQRFHIAQLQAAANNVRRQ